MEMIPYIDKSQALDTYTSAPNDEYVGIPPPPPHTQKKRSPALLAILLVSAVLLFGVSGLFYLARTYAVDHWKPTPVVIVVTPTPTVPAYQQELLATDFPTFISGFRQALAANDVEALNRVEDGVHFTELCDMADSSCTNDGKTTKAQLTKSELHLFIPSDFSYVNNPPVASVCNHVEPESGNAWIFVYGTYAQTADLIVPVNGPVAFGFQQPSVGSPWTWDTIILNMSSC